ncbi:hypothetical protein M407DRAFT_185280 [Tulasnella calospora MUT 4182]|uniref:Uncharacterized protein n=1 Tax=Tulasnella calospora MUT 4182 TaxID=1051891 RepID=A0A0C3M2N6_9AGAM|nr:hypothetical protein M407DRAFT_185280 [Tulasnella calospora MUT 4182]
MPGGGRGRGGSGGSTGSKGSSSVSISSSYGGKSFSSGFGGGRPFSIPAGQVFAGRLTGGGTRDQIYGTQRYGSGYTYSDRGSFVTGRGFPFGFWPIYAFPIAYYGNREYGPWHNSSRPGRNMSWTQVTSSSWSQQAQKRGLLERQQITNNATAPYYLIGDYDSLVAVSDLLRSDCNATVGGVIDYNPDQNAIPPEEFLQYYRSSSFALTLSSYWDPANSVNNQPASNDSALTTVPDVPIPPGTDLNFLDCLNSTIGNNLPVMDAAVMTRVQATVFAQLALFWVILSMIGLV